jgi:hypothetical protein
LVLTDLRDEKFPFLPCCPLRKKEWNDPKEGISESNLLCVLGLATGWRQRGAKVKFRIMRNEMLPDAAKNYAPERDSVVSFEVRNACISTEGS